MERLTIPPRNDWRNKVESVGMNYHTIDGNIYWDESACYRFSSREIDELDSATAALQEMCIEAADAVIRKNLFQRLRIPERFIPVIVSSWEKDEPSLYGRFDLAYDGENPPRMLEYNADTPTSLLESGVVQWFWLRELFPGGDQFNSIHEKLIDAWKSWPALQGDTLHFACAGGSDEDFGNLEYIRDTAIQAGFRTRQLFMDEIGWDSRSGSFVDCENRPIQSLFKLYPWEWMNAEEFGTHIPAASVQWIEPAWKMLLSNKGILPILWELFPGHPNLLESTTEDSPLPGDYVRKPLLSREGANILLRRNGEWIGTAGSYGEEGHVYQRYHPLPEFSGNYPVTGSWIIAGEPAGIGIREDRSEITTNLSRFIPHLFVEV